MGISDLIACFIQDVLQNEDGCAELQRAELANRFGCVPSQINYVISTRFTPEHGYAVESRRGGGGYIRIRRVTLDECCVMHVINSVGDSIDPATTRAFLTNLIDAGAVQPFQAQLMAAAVSDNALRCLPQPDRDRARASILKQMLTQAICKGAEQS